MIFNHFRARVATCATIMIALIGVSAQTPLVAVAISPQIAAEAPVQVRPASASANLFTNGEFSAGLTGWTAITIPTIYNASAVGGVARLNPVGAIEQIVSVTPGVVHTLTAHVRINQQFELSGGDFDGATVLVRQTDPAGTFIASSGTYTVGNSPIGVWTPIYVIFTPAAGVTSVKVSFAVVGNVFFGQPISTQMNVDADNFVLSTLPTELSVKPTSTSPAPCARPANVLQNGDFSSNINTGWRTLVITNSAFLTITTPMTSANGVAEFNPDGWIIQSFDTTVGRTYYASAWTKVDQVIAPQPNGFLIMQFRANTGGNVDGLGLFRDTAGDWARSYFTFTATTVKTDAYFLTGGNIRMRGSVDDIIVSECPIPSARSGAFVRGDKLIFLPLTASGQ